MKISTIPRSPETGDKRECTLVSSSSSSDTKAPLSDNSDTSGFRELDNHHNNHQYDDNDDHKDVKLKKKTICQETVYEFEEDGLTMERVGK